MLGRLVASKLGYHAAMKSFRSCLAAPVSGLLALAFLLAPVAGSAQQSVTVIVNGQTMSFDQPPIVRAGRVFVPLRGVFERLGASVVYSNGQINATGAGRTVSLTIGSTQATVNGQPSSLDVAPFLVGDRTLVPLRFIAQSLGASVNWNDANSTVTIFGHGATRERPGPPRGGVTFSYRSPTGTINNPFPQIQFQVSRPARIAGFQVSIDGRPIGRPVLESGHYFYVNSPWRLGMGTHRVRVYGQTIAGVPFDLTWSFYQGAY
jgi:hypothetical protein